MPVECRHPGKEEPTSNLLETFRDGSLWDGVERGSPVMDMDGELRCRSVRADRRAAQGWWDPHVSLKEEEEEALTTAWV